jgi:hypothetical protein
MQQGAPPWPDHAPIPWLQPRPGATQTALPTVPRSRRAEPDFVAVRSDAEGRFRARALVLDTTANALGAVLSDATAGVVGQ